MNEGNMATAVQEADAETMATVVQEADAEEDTCHSATMELPLPHTATTTTPDSILAIRNISLDRKSDLCRSWALILAYLLTEMVKQLSNYAATLNDDGASPVPPVLLVLLTELTKLVLVLCWAVVSRSRLVKWTPSTKFGVPAACYLATNVLYLLAIRSTAPPLWLMLIQTRTFYTVGVYLVVFGREVSWGQLTGCLLVVASLPLAHASELEEGRPALLPFALVASQAAALLSTVASIVIELLLKNDSRSFCEQQTWLYCWSGLMAAISLVLQAPPLTLSSLNLQSPSTWWCMLAVVSSATSGLCVPVIVRSLDTIAKDYLAALNNVLLALLTAALFPDHFTLSGLFLLSLLVLLCGIWLYERKTPVPSVLSHGKTGVC